MKVKQKDGRRMYIDLAWAWSIISPKENYIPEAEEIRKVIESHAQVKIKDILHLGCGGGHLDYTFKNYCEVTGADVSEDMLGLARKLNPEVNYLIGDMRNMQLDRAVDAVIIADSIDYMLPEKELRKSFWTAFEHLIPGGVFYTYAEVTRERFQQNRIYVTTHKQGDIEITLIENNYDPDPTDTMYESVFLYLIRRKSRLEIETDQHLGGIFPQTTWFNLLKEVGFDRKETIFDLEGIPAFVGIKP
jgi:hypothetical protein